ncbi:MAG: murein biosynthesis integral membrane protein MurJ [Rhodobacteraceae bacterium]|nr:murein biosynthesis integral membrane protein MurJ [Paracoccaceae bacterium]
MVSRVFGLLREIMIAALLGSGPVAEAFFVAFRFPNLFRRFFAEGAFNMAFVPLFARRLEGEGVESARGFAEEALAGLFSVLFVLVLAAQLAMPWLIFVIAYGFADDPEKLDLAVVFTQIQFPYLLFMSLTALFSGVLNSLGKFAVAAGAPILLNLSMIGAMAGAWALELSVGHALAWSVLVAGILQFALVAIAARRAGFGLRLRWPRWTPGVGRLLALGAPGAIAGGVTQVNILIGTTVATFFDGAVTWLTYADRVYQLPLGVVGVAIGVALLPELSRRVRAGDAAAADATLNRAIEFALALTLPAAVALLVIPEEVARLLFQRGAFTAEDAAKTGAALALFALGLPAYVLIKALSPAYFADEDTKTPLRFAAISVATNIILSIGLAPVIGWYGVAVGTAAAAWVNVALLWRGIVRGGVYAIAPETKSRAARMAVASALMGVGLAGAAWVLSDAANDVLWRYPVILGLVAFGIGLYALLSVGLGAVSLQELKAAMRRRSGDSRPVDGGAAEG